MKSVEEETKSLLLSNVVRLGKCTSVEHQKQVLESSDAGWNIAVGKIPSKKDKVKEIKQL